MSDLRRAVLAALGKRPTAAQREQLADVLEALAREQRQIASAERRQHGRPAAERATPRSGRAGPGRRPARFIRIEREERAGRERLIVHIGRGLYYDLGSPARLDLQRLAGRIELRPATGDVGYALNVSKGMPRFYADGARELLEDLRGGRYVAEVQGGAIVVGPPLE